MDSNSRPRSVAGICIKDNKLFIAKRIPGGSMGERWEFPGGKVEPGETDEEALIREYYEEFGIPVTVGACIAHAEFEHHQQKRFLFAYIVYMDTMNFTLTEHTQWRWASLEEIEKLDFADSDKKLIPDLHKLLQR
ncbi:MAG TPA: (deoxy)nucleoside triphosphate pyrophosphohydrolase [Treponema sp.]|nr:(deoxy)nucleoside triphosphate pyrophosphohydrolase [Treponema sp.]HPC70343.1 (deoxy)nucleoside triphosphate pyrophosphohydrolase [Treponema sp.]HRS04134.1 (deoxy)nucleoside triphosphate pyrophosphohydrolase [Treponema sp.]HRU27653.1 (deoxy)nucleoside triphosphate pyrophosphohydrolase [Treponema sp.]